MDKEMEKSVHKIMTLFGEFMRLSKESQIVKSYGLKARKKSIELRDELKNWRKISLDRER